MNERNLAVALLILRIGLAVFLLLFGVDKLVAPVTTADVYARYYGLAVSPEFVYVAGTLEILLGFALLAGAWKTAIYGLGLLLHTVSTLATYQELLSPFGANHLFIAAIPVLAGFIVLFLLRRNDTLWSVH